MFRTKSLVRLSFACASALLLSIGGGCGNGAVASLPPNEVARGALEAALKSWRDGGKPGALSGTDPPVQVFDTPWSQGDRLASYEIQGEEAGTAERKFNVRLVLAKPERTQEVKYYVMGSGPIMVFREEDYLRNINMEEGPKIKKSGNRGRRGG